MITAAGSGYSRWHNLAVTRWREDVTCDMWGAYVFLRDVDSGAVWSAGYQPAGVEPDRYEAVFSEDLAEITFGATARSPPPSRSPSRPKTTPRFAAHRSRITAATIGRSR